jgi:formamidopyrimidine-DNA glycosylase
LNLVPAVPELPDVLVYVDALRARIVGEVLQGVTLASPFVLRSVAPPIGDLAGTRVVDVSRSGKQVVFAFAGDRFLVVHLMVAGRFQWRDGGPPLRGRIVLARFEFRTGMLYLTEAGSKKRASMHVVAGAAGLSAFHRGGLEVLEATAQDFGAALRRADRALSRLLKDDWPRSLDEWDAHLDERRK